MEQATVESYRQLDSCRYLWLGHNTGPSEVAQGKAGTRPGYMPDILTSRKRIDGFHMLVGCIVVVSGESGRDCRVVDSRMRRLLDIAAGSQLGD